MDIDAFKPTFLIQIDGQTLLANITQEITSFVFEDNGKPKKPGWIFFRPFSYEKSSSHH